MEYLPQGNHVQAGDIAAADIDAAGKHVIIIGGGDTAADCLGHREPAGRAVGDRARPQPAPAGRGPAWSTRSGRRRRARGVARRPTTRACTRRGRARSSSSSATTTARCARSSSRRSRSSRVDGRREFRPVPGSRTELPADLVLLAAGFVGTDVPELLAALEVDGDPARGTAVVDDGWRTSADGRLLLRRRHPRRLARGLGDRRRAGLRRRGRRHAHRRVGPAPPVMPRAAAALTSRSSRRDRCSHGSDAAAACGAGRSPATARPAADRPRCSRGRWPGPARRPSRPARRRRRARCAQPNRNSARRVVGLGQPAGQLPPQRPAVEAAVVDRHPDRVAHRDALQRHRRSARPARRPGRTACRASRRRAPRRTARA